MDFIGRNQVGHCDVTSRLGTPSLYNYVERYTVYPVTFDFCDILKFSYTEQEDIYNLIIHLVTTTTLGS